MNRPSLQHGTAPEQATAEYARRTTESPHPYVMPDYGGGSIVNLMSALRMACGVEGAMPYPAACGLDPDLIAAHRTILLMVIDGLGDGFLQRTVPGGELHSRRLRPLTSVFPSTTAAAITSFLTGVAPQQHGLTGWFMYLRELGGVFAILPAKPRAGGLMSSAGGLAPKRVFDSAPVFSGLRRRSIVLMPRRIAASDYNLAHLGPATLRTYDSLDEFFLTVALLVRESSDEPRFIYAYWPELDALGHETGIGSVECASHLAQIDERFGRLCRRLAGSDAWVALTADHGMIDVAADQRIELSDHPQLMETLSLPLCGERRATYCYVKPRRTAEFEAYVTAELEYCARLIPFEQLLADGYFGHGEPHPRLAERIGDYALLMRGGYVLQDWLPGEKRHHHIGFHGGLSAEEMYVPLITASL